MAIQDKIYEFGASILREAQARRNMIDKQRASGVYTEQFIGEERQKAYGSIIQQVKQWYDEQRQNISKQMAGIEAKYQRAAGEDATKALLNFNRTQARLKAMSVEELRQKADQYIKDGKISGTDELDLLIAELQAKGLGNYADGVRLAAKQNYFTYEPWKADPQYQALVNDLTAINNCSQFPDNIFIKNASGVIEVRSIDRTLKGIDEPVSVRVSGYAF